MSDASVLLAFDYGEKRIGVALGNTLMRCAKALTILENRNRIYRFEAIADLIKQWQPQALIVGLPCHPDGAPHRMTQQAQRFGAQLHERFSLPVTWVDERYSSVAADTVLNDNRRDNHYSTAGRDAEAARIILQQFFD